MTVRIYTAKHCTPCHEIAELIKKGRATEDVELIDIETDEGFARFTQEVLEHGEGAVPSAYRDGERCAILIDEVTKDLLIECPRDGPPASE